MPLIIGEMQIASAARCHLTPVRTAAVQRRRCEGAGTLARCRGPLQPPWEATARPAARAFLHRKCRRDVQERLARAPRTAHGGHGTEASRVPVDGRDAAAHPVMTRYSASREKDTLPCETARGAPGGVRHVGRQKADGRDELCAIALHGGPEKARLITTERNGARRGWEVGDQGEVCGGRELAGPGGLRPGAAHAGGAVITLAGRRGLRRSHRENEPLAPRRGRLLSACGGGRAAAHRRTRWACRTPRTPGTSQGM